MGISTPGVCEARAAANIAFRDLDEDGNRSHYSTRKITVQPARQLGRWKSSASPGGWGKRVSMMRMPNFAYMRPNGASGSAPLSQANPP